MTRKPWRIGSAVLIVAAAYGCHAPSPSALSISGSGNRGTASPSPAATPVPTAAPVAVNTGTIAGRVLGPDSSLLSTNLASVVGNSSTGLIANNGSGMISDQGSSLISNNSGGLISNNSGSYRLLAWSPVPAAGAQVVALDPQGNPLCAPVQAASDGSFSLGQLKSSGPIVFLHATYVANGVKVTLEAAVPAPRSGNASGTHVDPATTLVAKKTERLIATGQTSDAVLDPHALATSVNAIAPYVSTLAAAAAVCLDADQTAQVFDRMVQVSSALKADMAQALGNGALDLLKVATVDPSEALATPNPASNPTAAPTSTPTPLPPGATPNPLVVGIDQPTGHAGSAFYLSGVSLNNDLIVNFPGGQSVGMTALGAGRGRVYVPSGATAGNLTVTEGALSFGPWPFQTLSYAAGMAGSTGAWAGEPSRQLPSLNTARQGAASAQFGHTVYVLGGNSGSGDLATIERATLNADGTLGAFSPLSTTLSQARSYGGAFVAGSYLYVVGGKSGGSPLGSVERATINADGSLGAFSVVTSLATARSGFGLCLVGDCVYVVGGVGSTTLSSVEAATINGDGTISGFSTPSSALVSARAGLGCFVAGNYLYAIAGNNGTTDLATIERAQINADGTLGSFVLDQGVQLRVARSYFALFVDDHQIAVEGGMNNGSVNGTREQASFQDDGTLGSFANAPLVVPAVAGAATGMSEDQAYAIGGHGASGVVSVIQPDSFNASGNLGTVSAASVSMTQKRGYFRTIVSGQVVYAIGGVATTGAGPALTAIDQATINADGTLGTFTRSPSISLSTARCCHSVVAIGPYVYAIGGSSSDENGASLASIESAPVGLNGTLGTFAPIAATLNVPRKNFATAVIGSYLYVIGGSNSGTIVQSIERAPINPDGTLGSFVLLPSSCQLTVTRMYHTAMQIGGVLYVIGGETSGSGALSSIEQALINPDGTLGNFSVNNSISLATAGGEFTSAVVGPYMYLFGGWNGSALSTIQRAPITTGVLGTFSNLNSTLTIKRDAPAAVLTGAGVYVLGGDDELGIDWMPLQ